MQEFPVQIAILLYDRFTALDAVGPYEVLGRIPGAELVFVGREARPYRTDTGSLAIVADRTLDEVPRPGLLLVPGGPGSDEAAEDEAILAWVRAAHEHTRWTTSVCTGSHILAAAGVLDGVEATTHWAAFDRLRALGVAPVSERFVRRGKIVTAAGVSAGIDMALGLVQAELGDDVAQAIQLGIEYDPDPPLDSGHPSKAPEPIVELVAGMIASRDATPA